MTNEKLSLDKKITYQIKVPGDVLQYKIGTGSEISAVLGEKSDGQNITTFTCTFDQAGLHEFLQLLYAKGLALISVKSIDDI